MTLWFVGAGGSLSSADEWPTLTVAPESAMLRSCTLQPGPLWGGALRWPDLCRGPEILSVQPEAKLSRELREGALVFNLKGSQEQHSRRETWSVRGVASTAVLGVTYPGTTPTTNSDLPTLPVELRPGGKCHCGNERRHQGGGSGRGGEWCGYSSPGNAACNRAHHTRSSLRHVKNVCDRFKSLQFIKYKSRL